MSSTKSSIWRQLSSVQVVLPAGSVARTVRLCAPTVRPVGDEATAARGPGAAVVEPALDRGRGVVDGDVEARGRPLGRLGRALHDVEVGRLEVGRPAQHDGRRIGGAGAVDRADGRDVLALPEVAAMSQAPRLQSSHSLVSMRHSHLRGGRGAARRRARPCAARSRSAGALVTVVSGADRSVVQRHGSAVPVLPPASTARASNTCAPSATVTDAGHAPQAPPSSRHSRRAARSSDEQQ